ncbi:MAG: PAS domain S-box protein [Planctomycetes bacterium]|nr:PAS domain S-box protein [Planctomycetota bacterium]
MQNPGAGRGLHRIRNKVLAVLVAVAVLPAVAVSLYALRKASDALSEQALTLLSESCVTDARRVRDVLEGAEQQLAILANQNDDPRHLLATFQPDRDETSSGERRALSDDEWKTVRRDLTEVEQRLRLHQDQQRSCELAIVLSPAFGGDGMTPILWLDRDGEPRARQLLERDAQGFPRPIVPPAGELLPLLIAAFANVRDEHPDLDLLRATLPRPGDSGDDALELFAGRVQGEFGTEYGWIFVVHSWRRLLRELHSDATQEGLALRSVFDARGLAPIASSEAGRLVTLPSEFGLRDHALSLRANAAMFQKGDMVAFAPFHPCSDNTSLNYVLAVERPARELLDNVHRFRVVFTGVLIGALLFAALVGLFLTRRLTRPLEVLRDGAIRIGRGELTQTIDLRTGDEAEVLAREFNAMAGELRSLYAGMEKTIAERTLQLQNALDELRRAHAQIVDSEKRYSDIVENASDLIQVTDAKGAIVSANRRQAERLGTTVDALKGRPFLEFVAADAREATRKAFARVLEGGALKAFDSALIGHGDAPGFPVEISATPVVEDGKAIGVRAILRDASERKAMEARLIKAERLSSVGALAAGVAHEINNPLGIITMFAQRVLERAKKGEVDVDKLEKIVEQGKRVAGITRNLLDFARAAPTRFAPFDLREVVESTVALLADRAAMQSITLRLELADGLPTLVGNRQQLSQVLLNLMLNAFQAIGKDATVIVRACEVATSRLPTAGRAVRIAVEDNGPGIPADVLPHLFEPFFTTKAPGEGTGLGLSVSWGIVKEHHGALFAENRSEGGARFELELPIEGSPAHAAEANRPTPTTNRES